ncbi:MAG: hypothetical protein QOH95_1709 [Gaiellaceae bacterium]|nr:hypothetical protein [Gaiellaceae bacterium]
MRRIATVVLLLVFTAGAVAWRLADVKPDPNVQAIADGCQRDTTKIYTGFAPNWVYVNDRDYPASGPPPAPRSVSGVVKGASGLLASRIASADDPITHRSVDVNIDLTVDAQSDFLTGTSRDATPEQGTLHLERESDYYPEWTRPQPGDRLQALGSWIWDCDHYQGKGEKTELHPFRVTWVARHPARPSPTSRSGQAEGDLYLSTDATPAGQAAECAHTTKGSDGFKACTHAASDTLSINGSYEFSLCAPQPRPKGASTVWRIVDRGSVNAPKVTLFPGNGGCASIRFAVNAAPGTRVVVAKQIYLGWSRPEKVDHLRLHFDSLLVRRAMDPSCPPDKPACPSANQSTLLGQIATAPGEWQLHWSVDGIWGRWPGTLAAKDGSTFRGSQSVDFYLARGAAWTLVTLARECDFGALPGFAGPGHPMRPCPTSGEVGNSTGDDYPGAIAVTFRGAALGRHVSNASTAGSTCPPSNVHGCYQLTYTVSRVR